jgi:membrane-bound inhibitor of C-type lysozyme
MQKPVLAFLIAISAISPVVAVETSIEITLGTQGDFERRDVRYECSEGDPFTVTYINAAPNFLALVPIADEPELQVFASVISASGARYASGQWVWWTKGAEATLYDETLGEDAGPVLTCSEFIMTP